MQDHSPEIDTIRLSDYSYDLPQDRIAQYPFPERDHSKLLVYRKGKIRHHIFKELADELDKGCLLVFNETRVIRARLYFRRETGGLIEIFLLHPEFPRDVQQAMQTTGSCIWQCTIGRKKRWKEGEILRQTIRTGDKQTTILAELTNRANNMVKLTWDHPDIPFATLLSFLGELPLPPYIQRKATTDDIEQYQTVYARKEGAVAAPTAGLHFTERVLESLGQKGIGLEYITLHVGAGTFLPIKHDRVVDHDMHSEQMVITLTNLRRMIDHTGPVIAVGTTSMRVLESLYWLGVMLMKKPENGQKDIFFRIHKLTPYQWKNESLPDRKNALMAVLRFMEQYGLDTWIGETEIFIMPGYLFRVCDGLITNFHMSETTLILLVAGFIGPDWRKVYEEALSKGYRFLSYGDSSLLLP